MPPFCVEGHSGQHLFKAPSQTCAENRPGSFASHNLLLHSQSPLSPLSALNMSYGPPQLTPDELALLPHDDRGPTLCGVSWLLTVLASGFLTLRIYCKFIGRRTLWWDDWILIASWVGTLLAFLRSLYRCWLTQLVFSVGIACHR